MVIQMSTSLKYKYRPCKYKLLFAQSFDSELIDIDKKRQNNKSVDITFVRLEISDELDKWQNII